MRLASTYRIHHRVGQIYARFLSTSIQREPIKPYPVSPQKSVPDHIRRPPYAKSGRVPHVAPNQILIHDEYSAELMRQAGRLARQSLELACSLAKPGITTDEIDTHVHEAIIAKGAYPSPLNYAGFPKSLCSSINEVICHGIPDTRPLQFGDIVSFDVSCYLNGVHGDNCATIIVGDEQDMDEIGRDWRGLPFLNAFSNSDDRKIMERARRLVGAARESLYAGISVCKPGGCLSDVGNAIQDVADSYGYSSVEKYRGHGISDQFHCAPFVKHYRNNDRLELIPGMIFTIEPMLTEGKSACHEWSDEWTVVTDDLSMAAQFEHMVLITNDGVEILTLP